MYEICLKTTGESLPVILPATPLTQQESFPSAPFFQAVIIYAAGCDTNKNSVCAIFAHTAIYGKVYKIQFYNLDAIISVGYRVNSIQATHFRIWATERLKEYIIKGFTMDNYPVLRIF